MCTCGDLVAPLPEQVCVHVGIWLPLYLSRCVSCGDLVAPLPEQVCVHVGIWLPLDPLPEQKDLVSPFPEQVSVCGFGFL